MVGEPLSDLKKNLTDNYLLKIELLLTDVTALWSPALVESDFLG